MCRRTLTFLIKIKVGYNPCTKNVPNYYNNRDKKSREGNHSLTTTKTQTQYTTDAPRWSGCPLNGTEVFKFL